MTTTKISQLGAADVLTGAEQVPVVQGGQSKKTTVAEFLAGKQPLDSDLTAIAALSTTSYGRAFLALADAAAARSALALGTGAVADKVAAGATGVLDATDPTTTNTRVPTDVSVTNAKVAVGAAIDQSKIANLTTDLAGKQPLDSDLTAIAALSTTSYGRAFLALADAAAARSALALGTGAVADKVAAGATGVLDATDPTTTNTRVPTAHKTSHAAGGSDVVSVAPAVLLANRPAAAAGNADTYVFVTDLNGGTLQRSNGGSWVSVAAGLAEAPVAHAARHMPGGADASVAAARLTADHAGVVNSTTLVDSGMSFAVQANEVWAFVLTVFYTAGSGSTGGKLRVGWSLPAGSDGKWGGHGIGAAETAQPGLFTAKSNPIATTMSHGAVGTTVEIMSLFSGTIVVGATPGTAKVQYAQQTVDAVNTTIMRSHSHLEATRLV